MATVSIFPLAPWPMTMLSLLAMVPPPMAMELDSFAAAKWPIPIAFAALAEALRPKAVALAPAARELAPIAVAP